MHVNDIKGADPASKFYASFGEIMLRLSPPDHERFLQSPHLDACFGGGESNVLISLAIQGLKTRFITALPYNDIGIAAKRTLQGFGVDVSNIILRPDSRIGIYFMEKGANQRASRVIYDRNFSAVHFLEDGEVDWGGAFSDCGWFHITGITPALSQGLAEQSVVAVKTAKERGLIVSCDLNYRANLWKYGKLPTEVMPQIIHYADIIIANEEDCQKALGIEIDVDLGAGYIDEKKYKRLTEHVLQTYPNAMLIGITLRESISASSNRWSACLNNREDFYVSRKYEINNIVDRVGTGDSFAAGLIYGLSKLSSEKDALEYATAASCLKHSIEGDLNLSSPSEINALVKGQSSGRISR